MAFSEFLIGKRTRLSWVKEDTFGVEGDMANDGKILGYNATISPDFNNNWFEILSDGSDGRTVQKRELGPLDLPFTLNFSIVEGEFMKYLGYDFSTNGTDPYVHDGTLRNKLLSFSLEWVIFASTPVVIKLVGCASFDGNINFAKASGDGDSMISVTLNCMARDLEVGDSPTTLSNDVLEKEPFRFRDVKFTKDDVEIIEVNNGDLSINNGIDPSDSRYCSATNDRLIGEFIPKVHRVTGKFNINMKDNTIINQWKEGEVIPDCKLEFIKNSDDYIEMGLKDFRISQAIPPAELDGVYKSDLNYSVERLSPLIIRDDIEEY